MKMNKITKFALLNLGLIIAAFPAVLFFSKANIPPGGLYSVAMIIFNVFNFGSNAADATSNIAILLNVPLLLLGFMVFGLNYLLAVTYSSFIYPIYIKIIAKMLVNVTYHPSAIMTIVVGGFLLGFGIAIAIYAGANTGGTDILGQVANYYFPSISVGSAIGFCNALIMILAALTIGGEKTIYGVAVIFVVAYTIDIILPMLKKRCK